MLLTDEPWRVSDCFSNEMGFCLNMTFPFFISANEVVVDIGEESDNGMVTPFQ